MIRIYKEDNYEQMSQRAADLILAQILLKPDCVLGLATGSTPIGLYEKLVEYYNNNRVDFSQVRTVNLDEYKGLDPNHPQSYHYFMNQNLFSKVNIDENNINLPNGMEEDSMKACAEYDVVIENLGGIDIQLLGIGHNGHIAFNEPAEYFTKGTNCVALTKSTIEANSRFFASPDEVPKYAYTMGIASIMKAKRILLVVNSKEKADIMKEAFLGNITPKVPASILQTHPDVIIVGDSEALRDFE